MTSGSSFCQIDALGCATDGAGGHGNNEACTIRVDAAGTLTATQFHTESCCDYVNISGILYRGSTGPNGVAVAAGSTFAWGSDGSVTNAGWTICLGKMRCCGATFDRPQPSLHGRSCTSCRWELALYDGACPPDAAQTTFYDFLR